ncbi:MAG: hypothetical protein P4L31_05435 [Candidatus Babeliales bacterium]|nr:hypothetical protein [Candidatus Babeliales bacterium]
MLSLLSWKNELITIIIDADQIVLHWIAPQKKSPTRTFILKAQAVVPIETGNNQSHLYNLTDIKKNVLQFIKTNNIKNAFACMAITAPGIVEQFVACPIASPTHDTFTSITPQNLIWDYVYLYPDDERNAFIFYLCGISQQQLLQYKLLAISSNIELKAVMTQQMALIQLYHAMQGPAFRHSQLAVSLQRTNNNIDKLFTSESIHRMLTIDPKVSLNFSQHAPYLRTTLGLALSSGLYKG